MTRAASTWKNNGLLRQYFLHGIDFGAVDEARLKEVEASLNRRPRETLDWKSPAEAYASTIAVTD